MCTGMLCYTKPKSMQNIFIIPIDSDLKNFFFIYRNGAIRIKTNNIFWIIGLCK